jgi:hypothetical protein
VTEQSQKLAASQARIWLAVKKILVYDENFTGQFDLEVHCKDGIVKDVYERNKRRKV